MKTIQNVKMINESVYVKKHREASGLSQSELGRKLGLTRQFICNIEKGRDKIPAEKVKLFCIITNSDPEHFFRIKIKDQELLLREKIYGKV